MPSPPDKTANQPIGYGIDEQIRFIFTDANEKIQRQFPDITDEKWTLANEKVNQLPDDRHKVRRTNKNRFPKITLFWQQGKTIKGSILKKLRKESQLLFLVSPKKSTILIFHANITKPVEIKYNDLKQRYPDLCREVRHLNKKKPTSTYSLPSKQPKIFMEEIKYPYKDTTNQNDLKHSYMSLKFYNENGVLSETTTQAISSGVAGHDDRILGRGGFGKVKYLKDKKKDIRVLKVQERDGDLAEEEAEILKDLGRQPSELVTETNDKGITKYYAAQQYTQRRSRCERE